MIRNKLKSNIFFLWLQYKYKNSNIYHCVACRNVNTASVRVHMFE